MADTKADPKPSKFYFRDIAGQPVQTSDAELAEGMAKTGDKPIGKEEAYQAAAAAKDLAYVDQNWGTVGKFAAGVGSGLTLGMGPGIASQMGLVDPGHLQAAQSSGWYTGGDVAGTMLPALLSGGEGLAGRSAIGKALSMSPAGLMEAGGSATERLVGKVLGEEAGVLGRMASAPAKMAARGAFEGAAINLGHTVGDALIQNKPLSAESLLASGVDGALMGGLIGGSIGTVGSLAGQAVEGLGKLGKSVLGRSGVREGLVFKRLGKTAEDVGAIERTVEGGKGGYLTKMNEILEESGTGAKIGSSDKVLREGFTESKKIYTKGLDDVATDLDANAANVAPHLEGMQKRLDAVKAVWANSLNQSKAFDVIDSLKSELAALGPNPTWKQWLTARDQLEHRLKDTIGKEAVENPLLRFDAKQIQHLVLDAIDTEIRGAMKGASEMAGLEGVAEKYAAAHTKLRIATEIEESLGKKMAADVMKSEPAITARDAGAFVGMAAIGHPASGLAWLAAKGIGRQLQGRLEPAIAQMAFDASVGTKALGATQNVQGRIAKTMTNFFKTASKAPAKASMVARSERKASKDPLTRAKYEEMASRTEQLLSDAHQDKVRRYAEMLHDQGYADFANQIMATNNRAVQYLMWNAPPRAGTKQLNSLRRMPASRVPSLSEYGYTRKVGYITNPMKILDDLENGSLSRDGVKAFKYVYPEVHSQIVEQATMQVWAMKQKGDSLPMSKIVSLGIALDAPIDSTLTPEFIGEVQSALAAGPAGATPPTPPAQPILSPDSYMTPLQKIVS